ncbi:MAG: Cas10/Cmr2 second palm domain-containing protein, partial [Ardenticatenaceae bacterium]
MSKERYLLAAEADKIQDLLFKASSLKEVIGGSMLLTRFCQRAPEEVLGLAQADVIISEGGAFRLLFDNHDDAVAGGRKLADVYARTLEGQMTVAELVLWSGDVADFRAVNQRAGRKLRAAKQAAGAAASAHIPHIALCASTGVDMAVRYEDPEGYLSYGSAMKKRERESRRWKFLRDFFRELKFPDSLEWPPDAGHVGRYDARNYVAYLVADGNGMGRLFDQCGSPEALRTLSDTLRDVLKASLEAPSKRLWKVASEDEQKGALVETCT